MYWHLLERAVGRGQATFDFGRSRPTATLPFKKQWGAEPHRRPNGSTTSGAARFGRGRPRPPPLPAAHPHLAAAAGRPDPADRPADRARHPLKPVGPGPGRQPRRGAERGNVRWQGPVPATGPRKAVKEPGGPGLDPRPHVASLGVTAPAKAIPCWSQAWRLVRPDPGRPGPRGSIRVHGSGIKCRRPARVIDLEVVARDPVVVGHEDLLELGSG